MITTNSDETQQLAYDIAKKVQAGDIVALRGDLGSGKTTFTQGFARALGIQKPITSPTFLIVKTYQVDLGDIKRLYHLDLYRVESEKDIEGIGISDILNDSQGVTIIEWAERMGSLLSKKYKDIQFNYIDETKREIIVEDKS